MKMPVCKICGSSEIEVEHPEGEESVIVWDSLLGSWQDKMTGKLFTYDEKQHELICNYCEDYCDGIEWKA